ncbi:MAG: ornithine decarboxylase, partial [Chitinophagaceae bacterium]
MNRQKQKHSTSLGHHRSVWEIRSDGWINLVDAIGHLVNLVADDPERAEILKRIRQTVEYLTPIESYWAFPGKRVFAELCQYIEREEFASAHHISRRIHRALIASTYRHDNNVLDSDRELPSQIETDSEQQARLARPYFEVLIVDEMSAGEEEALRRRVQSKRSVDDKFIFDI